MDNAERRSKLFWKDLEKQPVLMTPEAYKRAQTKALTTYKKLEKKLTFVAVTENPGSKLNQSIKDLWEMEKLERTVGRIQEANVEYLKNLKITVRNQTKKELRKAVMDIQEQFQLEVFTMKKEHNTMKEEINGKNRQIFGYGQYNVEQNSIIFCNAMRDPIAVEIEQDSTRNEIDSLKDSLRFYTVQLNAIKEVAAEYGKEADLAIKKVKEVDLEIQRIKNAHEVAMQMLRQAIGSEEEEVLAEKKAIKDEFEGFKNKISQELVIRDLLDIRQKEFISSLQNEIKDAKMILQNPRMRIRVHEKLKEAAEEVNQLLPTIVSKDKSDFRTQSAGKAGVRAEGKKIEIRRTALFSQGSPRNVVYTARHDKNSSFLFK